MADFVLNTAVDRRLPSRNLAMLVFWARRPWSVVDRQHEGVVNIPPTLARSTASVRTLHKRRQRLGNTGKLTAHIALAIVTLYLVTSPVARRSGCEILRWACMCLSVCLSVCPQGYIGNHTRDLYHFFRESCLWQGDEIPRGKGNFGGFPIHNALYTIAFGTRAKTAEPIEMPFAMMSGLGPRNSLLVMIPEGEG